MGRHWIVKIKLVRRYSIHEPGKVVDCDDGVASRLIADGVAVAVDPPEVIETASIDHDMEQAAMTPRRGRRKRHEIPQSEEADAPGG